MLVLPLVSWAIFIWNSMLFGLGAIEIIYNFTNIY